MKLWLDDIRECPPGWTWAKRAAEAIECLRTGEVEEVSLDHDLGACERCMNGQTVEDWLLATNFRSMPNCSHFGTGYTVACWIEEKAISGELGRLAWACHSSNVTGRNRIEATLGRAEKAWDRRGL